MTAEAFDLTRFRDAQAPVIERVLGELRSGRKRTHWMWFIFPQIEGLGFSAMAQRFAIGSLAEARAYLADPELGGRLRACVEAVLGHADEAAATILGDVDAVKFRSCLTLFAEAAPDEPAFRRGLAVFFAGEMDPATLARIS